MRVDCAWCGAVLSDGPVDDGISHGICPDCERGWLARGREEKTMARIGQERIEGELLDIEVDGGGTFSATYEDITYKAPTLLELKTTLGREVKKAKARQPIECSVVDMVPRTGKKHWETEIYEDGRGVVHALLRGKHKTQGVYLFRDLEKKAFKLSGYGDARRKVLRRLTDSEAAEYEQLAAHADEAEKLLEDWIAARRLDVEELCK